MTVLDAEIRATLERLVPRDTTPPAWDEVLARAGVRRRRRVAPRLLALAAVVVAAAVVVMVSPWERTGRVTFASRALAAIGDEPVLHAVIREQSTSPFRLIEIASGRTTSPRRTVETELWYDRAAALGHTIMRVDGKLVDDTLQTPSGTTNMDGVVYTCAWIAEHPVQATKEGVSCRFDGNNGTTPRKIPEAPPAVDPALAAFVGGYREQLASGRARKVGEGVVARTPVYWVELQPYVPPPIPGSEPPPRETETQPIIERVAIDRDTYRPLLVRS